MEYLNTIPYIFEPVDSFQRLQCIQAPSEKAFQKLKRDFKKYKKNAYMSKAVRHGFSDGKVAFFDDVYLPFTLWGELKKYMDSNGLACEIRGLDVFMNNDLTREEITEFMNDLLDGVLDEKGNSIEPRWYQYESVYLILKYRYSSQQISTSAGKTLISYSVAAWLKKMGKIDTNAKFLMIVPRAELSTQTRDKFIMYDGGKGNGLVVTSIGDGNKFDDDAWDNSNVIISTYQSLNTIPDSYFKSVKVINVDEAHTARTTSIRRVIGLSSPLRYKFGLSGTLLVHMNNAEYFENIAQLGPVTFEYNPDNLIADGYAPDVKITKVILDYDNYVNSEPNRFAEYKMMCETYKQMSSPALRGGDAALRFYKAFYTIEKQMIYSDERRLDAIMSYIATIDISKNILVLFNDVKDDFGKKIFARMNEIKTTRYIDGMTKSGDRKKYKDDVEDDEVNLVASFGTFSTGIDLKRIHYIVFAESYKSPILIGQSIGRGLRNHKSKKQIDIIDFVDTLYKHTQKQSTERDTVYNKFKYDIKKITITI